MKILWCIIFYLVFNDFQTIESKFQNEYEDASPLNNLMQRMEALEKEFAKHIEKTDKASDKKQQRLDALEKLHEENNKTQEENKQKIGALEKLLEENIKSNKALELPQERVDCGEKCDNDESCTSVFWINSSDSECRFNQDKSTLVKFVPGELYYCKDCQSTLDFVFEAEDSGVIKLANVASNKTTQASSYANELSNPSKAVDGDPNTWFSSEAHLTEEEPWLMVDLGQRFLVAQIRIQVRMKTIYKTRGGYFKVCLVDTFDEKVNPCNQQSEILKVNTRLRAYSKSYEVEKVMMGRYVVVQKLEEQVLEIAELEVLSVIPIMSYECASCLAKSNTVCDESRIPPVCSCTDNHLPVDGDARNGCKDPCLDFNEDNAVCDKVDHETRNCSCNTGYKPVKGDACNGCNDPCIGFKDRNNICIAVSFEIFSCECKEGHFEIFRGDPCFGCIVCPSSLGYKVYRNFGCLKEQRTTKKWEDARSTCVSEGGDLFTPGDKQPLLPKDEMNLVTSHFHWIGVRRSGRKGPYERINSGQTLADDSPLWVSSEPNRNSDHECVLYYSRDGLLRDTTCTSNRYFICEINGF